MHLQNSLNIAITIVFLLFSSFYFPRPSFFTPHLLPHRFFLQLLLLLFCFFTSSFSSSSSSPSPHLHPFSSSPLLLFFLILLHLFKITFLSLRIRTMFHDVPSDTTSLRLSNNQQIFTHPHTSISTSLGSHVTFLSSE